MPYLTLSCYSLTTLSGPSHLGVIYSMRYAFAVTALALFVLLFFHAVTQESGNPLHKSQEWRFFGNVYGTRFVREESTSIGLLVRRLTLEHVAGIQWLLQNFVTTVIKRSSSPVLQNVLIFLKKKIYLFSRVKNWSSSTHLSAVWIHSMQL